MLSIFQVIGAVICLVAVFGYFNHRFIRLPDATGITAIGMAVSIAAVAYGQYDADFSNGVKHMIGKVNFADTLLHGILGLLLFAGSLHIQFEDIAKEKWLILALATIGVVISTVLVGGALFGVTQALHLNIPLLYCLMFGALISPTDPIAVLAILKRLGVPKSLETRIAGESLFNDGTGVVIFLTLLGMTPDSGHATTIGSTAALFITEVAGGAAFGAAAGYIGFLMLRSVDSYAVEILITLALATGGYAAAEAIHVSAPIAVVVMGLIVGNRGKKEAMSEETRARLFDFWEILDELLNLLLFGLIGLEMVILSFSRTEALIGAASIVIVLAARFISIAGPILAAKRLRNYSRAAIIIMGWGGLRGGISIALALSLPEFSGREYIVSATYLVVVFSILVQALTLGKVARRALNVPAGNASE